MNSREFEKVRGIKKSLGNSKNARVFEEFKRVQVKFKRIQVTFKII